MKQVPSFEELVTKLDPALKSVEAKRKQLKKEAARSSLLWSAGALCLGIILSFFAAYGLAIIFTVVLIVTICLFQFYSQRSVLRKFYKKKIITAMVKELVEQGSYHPHRGVDESVFNDCALFTTPDRYHSEDFISGMIEKTSFYFSEVHAEEKIVTSNGKSTSEHWVTIFRGFFFIADFHKDFSGKTVVSRNSFLKLRRGRVKLENTEFEKRFDVFSTDQVEARYILTPSMMERIVALDKRMDGNVALSFSRSNVIIAIKNATDHFETGLWSNPENTRTLLREYNLIISMISIVEELNLNTRIWSKK